MAFMNYSIRCAWKQMEGIANGHNTGKTFLPTFSKEQKKHKKCLLTSPLPQPALPPYPCLHLTSLLCAVVGR